MSDHREPTPDPECESAPPGGCASCPSRGSCGKVNARSAPDPETLKIRERMSDIANIVIILSGKGGVGKSTICTQIGYYLAEVMHKRVGILDVDMCGPSLPTMTATRDSEVHQSALGWEPITVTENLAVLSIGYLLPNPDDPVIWRGPRKNGLIQQFLSTVYWGELDYLLIDTPPGTSDEHISVLTMLADATPTKRTSAVIVTTPQEVSLADVRKEVNFCHAMDLPVLGVVENMSGFVCPCCGKETVIFHPSTGGAKTMCETMTPTLRFLGRVPLDTQLSLAGEKGTFWHALVEAKKEEEGATASVSVGFDMFAEIVKQITTILG